MNSFDEFFVYKAVQISRPERMTCVDKIKTDLASLVNENADLRETIIEYARFSKHRLSSHNLFLIVR